MAKEPSVPALTAPVKAQELLREERRKHDCTSCRLVGGTAFIGLAAYTYWEGTKQLEQNRAAILAKKPRWLFGIQGRRNALAGISLGMAWMGLYRWFG